MNNGDILITGERPSLVPNPSRCGEFQRLYPTLFAPLQTSTHKKVCAGRSAVLIAPTCSGKTLAVAAPIFESGLPAVFVYPFRALALDQTNQLVRYSQPFGLTKDDFGLVMGGAGNRVLSEAVAKRYLLMTPDKLVSLLEGGRTPKAAALTILSKYLFVFDEIHAYNTLMRISLVNFIRSVRNWRGAPAGNIPPFYFLSATFPEEFWPTLQNELELCNDDRIEGVSNTGDITLVLKPQKQNPDEIVRDMKALGMTSNVVGIFNTATTAWRVAEKLWGRSIAKRRVFVGQDKMSEKERVENFEEFIARPEQGGLCGSPAIEAGVDFGAANVVVQETYVSNFLQRLGRAARSGQNARVLCYSNALFSLWQQRQLLEEYTRTAFFSAVKDNLPVSEPKAMLTGIAAYPYYRFWSRPDFIKNETRFLCAKLEAKGVEHLLAFRGFAPYTKYETGESIGYQALFKRALRMEEGTVLGTPSLERYFFAKKRPPVIAKLIKCAHAEKPDQDTTVLLAKVAFDGFGTHWTVLEIKSDEYEHTHPHEEDDNICLRGFPSGEIGRISSAGVRNGIVRFYEVDA
jgi:superfamily II DNA/RNA helicase